MAATSRLPCPATGKYSQYVEAFGDDAIIKLRFRISAIGRVHLLRFHVVRDVGATTGGRSIAAWRIRARDGLSGDDEPGIHPDIQQNVTAAFWRARAS